jgi:protocatechuate 3,4-dioxygenase beta subunit
VGSDFSEDTATQAVVDSFASAEDVRLRQLLESCTRHLHGFVREVEPTQGEWEAAIAFLTEVGHSCDDQRQEFILLSDVMGVSMLVDAINNRKPAGATESTVLGPFHVVESPVRELGDDIADGNDSPRCLVRGQVLDLDGEPVAGAQVDVWQADAEGLYDIQKGNALDPDLRGLFTTDSEGRYWFTTVVPSHYPIPDDGPVGKLLRATGRHPYRPAHIHLITGAVGFSPVTTHLFIEGSPYLDDDTVFGVKQSLVRAVTFEDDPETAGFLGLPNPFRVLDFDVTLGPVDQPARR